MNTIKIFKQTWACSRCGIENKVDKKISTPYQYAINHICKCGKIKVLVNNGIIVK